jgi:hypothetical protein
MMSIKNDVTTAGNKNITLPDGWSFVTRRMNEERGWWPNRVAYNTKQNTALISVQRRDENTDFSLSVTALQDLITAVQNRDVKSGVVRLSGPDGSFVAEKTVQYVFNKLSEVQPDPGRFGPHWWIDENFEPLEAVNPIDDRCPI